MRVSCICRQALAAIVCGLLFFGGIMWAVATATIKFCDWMGWEPEDPALKLDREAEHIAKHLVSPLPSIAALPPFFYGWVCDCSGRTTTSSGLPAHSLMQLACQPQPLLCCIGSA